MTIAKYLNYIWIETKNTTGFNCLLDKFGNKYIEAKKYFKINYGICVNDAMLVSNDEYGVMLRLNLEENTIDAKTLYSISEYSIFGSESEYDELNGYNYHCTYILLPIEQTMLDFDNDDTLA